MSSSSSQAERLRSAAAQGDADTVKALLDAGVKIESDLEGRTALHLASANGHANTVKALINGGAKINALDAAGYSPLHQAATEGHEEVVRLLLKNGCHVDTQDELHGNTALHEAAWKGFSRTVETLCKHRANVYIKNNGGFTPLHLTCQQGHNQSCRVLLLSACKPDIRNSYGDTPLHTAARYGHAGVLRILLSAFANVNETNKNGDTALHISAAMGRNKLTRILLEAECDQKLKNNQGESARDIAERKEFTEVVRLMDNPPVTRIPVQEHISKKQHSKKREKDSNTSQESAQKEKKDKHKKSKKQHKVHFEKEKKGNVSPYGCHMFPDMNYFPSIKLQSLPQEPLKNGEQYYADLAGNIKKGPRGLGYMCYCAPFFNHVEKKLDANKKELLDHIDSRNEDLKVKISHLEKRTHDQLFSLNQKMKESLAIERGDCTERIDRRLFRERRELELQQERCIKELKSQMHHDQNGQVPNGYYNGYSPVGNQPLTRSKSEDLLSETNSNHNHSVSILSSTVTGTSRFTNHSAYNRTYLNPSQCGTKPKPSNGHLPNISRLRMRCMGYPELKRESRSEGDLTSCHTDATDHNSNIQKIHKPPGNGKFDLNMNRSRNVQIDSTAYLPNKNFRDSNYPLWRNNASQRDDRYSGFQSDASKSQNLSISSRPTFCTKYNHDKSRQLLTETPTSDLKVMPIRTQANGFQVVQNISQKPLIGDRENGLPSHIENDGSSFV